MKKFIILILTLVFIPVILLGCQSNDNIKLSDGEISKVNIFVSSGFGKMNMASDDFYIVYEDNETLEILSSLISNAVKQVGIVNMAQPEYDLGIIYTNGNKQGYHLWVGEKGEKSTLMKVDDTHTIYTVSEEMTNKLIDLVQ